MLYTHCLRSGEITVNAKPDMQGMICLGHGRNHRNFKDTIDAISRLAYDNKTLLVSGFPEADNDGEALEAVDKFTNMLKDRVAA